MLPKYDSSKIDREIERRVATMQSVIETGRLLRDRNTLPIKYPLKEVVLVDVDSTVLSDAQSLESYIVGELNVRKLTVSGDKAKYAVQLTAKPNHMLLGKRLKGDFKKVSAAIVALNDVQLSEMKETGEREICGHVIRFDELHVGYEVKGGEGGQYAAAAENNVLILLDCTTDQELMDEGLAREVVNRVQKLRKKAKLVPTDKITVYYTIKGKAGDLVRVVGSQKDLIETSLKSSFLGDTPSGTTVIEEEVDVKGTKMVLTLVCSPAWISGPVAGIWPPLWTLPECVL
eukprot:sb/3467692/